MDRNGQRALKGAQRSEKEQKDHLSTPFATYCKKGRVGLGYGPFGREEPCVLTHNVHTVPAPRHRVDRPAPQRRGTVRSWAELMCELELSPWCVGPDLRPGPVRSEELALAVALCTVYMYCTDTGTLEE